MLLTAPISNRYCFGNLLNMLRLSGPIIEVGTHLGEFAKVLLDNWFTDKKYIPHEANKLYCIDPWSIPIGYEPQVEKLSGKYTPEECYKIAQTNLQKYITDKRCVLVRKTSLEAVADFEDSSVAFVYLDGDHRKDVVYAELEAYYQKLKKGGLIAGHDFICNGEVNGGWGRGIQSAVFQFALKYDLDVYLIPDETDTPWSFYMVKK